MAEFAEELSQFENEGQYADWLLKTLTDFYHDLNQQEKTKPNPFNRFLIHSDADSATDALRKIYDHLETEKKTLFRKAIGEVLQRNAQNEETEVRSSLEQDLTNLIAQIRAIEPLKDLLAAFSQRPNNRLLYDCLSVGASFKPDEEIANFTSGLIEDPNFDDGYIFEAIGIMEKCQPDEAMNLVDRLGARITKLYNQVKQLGPDEETNYWKQASFVFRNNKAIFEKIVSYSIQKADD